LGVIGFLRLVICFEGFDTRLNTLDCCTLWSHIGMLGFGDGSGNKLKMKGACKSQERASNVIKFN
jgi:hypothetical protein